MASAAGTSPPERFARELLSKVEHASKEKSLLTDYLMNFTGLSELGFKMYCTGNCVSCSQKHWYTTKNYCLHLHPFFPNCIHAASLQEWQLQGGEGKTNESPKTQRIDHVAVPFPGRMLNLGCGVSPE